MSERTVVSSLSQPRGGLRYVFPFVLAYAVFVLTHSLLRVRMLYGACQFREHGGA